MKIEVDVNEGKGVRRILDIRVPAEEVEAEYKKTAEKMRGEVEIPGFRQGKAPANIIHVKFKDEISRSVLENMLPAVFSKALEQSEIKPVGEPELKDVVLKRGQPFTFRAIVDIKPEVNPTGYKGLKLYRQTYEITDEDVEKGIQNLRERLAIVSEVNDRPSKQGDIVMAEIKKLPGGDHIGEEKMVGSSDIQLDTKVSLPEFVENLTGKNIGDEVEFTVKYPEDYFEKDLANYTFKYQVAVKHIREKILPKTDSEFIEKLNLRDEDGNLIAPEKLHDKVRRDLEEGGELNVRRDMENQAVDMATKENQFDVPESVLSRYLDNLVKDYRQRNASIDEEKARDQLKPMADKFVRWLYIRDAIAEAEALKIEDEDIAKYRERLIKNTGVSEIDADKYIKAGDRLDNIKEQILEEKVLDYVIENAEIEDKKEEKKEENKKNSIIITPERK